MAGVIKKTVQLYLHCGLLKNHPSREEDDNLNVAMVNKLISGNNFSEN